MILPLLAALTVVVGGAETRFEVQALAAMPQAQASAVFHGAPQRCTGPRLDTVLAAAGAPAGQALRGEALSLAALATGGDGYRAAFALTGLDPLLGDDLIVVALRCDAPNSVQGGTFRLLADGDRRGARSVRDVQRIVVRLVAP